MTAKLSDDPNEVLRYAQDNGVDVYHAREKKPVTLIGPMPEDFEIDTNNGPIRSFTGAYIFIDRGGNVLPMTAGLAKEFDKRKVYKEPDTHVVIEPVALQGLSNVTDIDGMLEKIGETRTEDV